jgi:predicted HTH domain antitoxin
MAVHQVTIEVPEKVLLAEKMDATAFGQELRVLAAVKMYELGRLTSGRAADLAGMSRVEFLLALRQYKVFPLSAELEELEAAYG